MTNARPSATTPVDLRELTSIRFFAALYVVLFHAYDNLPWLYDQENGLIRNGPLGVDLFFILSGMILTHVNLPHIKAGSFRFRAFLVHRLARIYPLHVAMFLAFVVLYAVAARLGVLREAEGRNWAYAAPHLALVHAWGATQGHAWNGPSWSISAEFFAYLSFPVCVLLMRSMRPGTGLVLALGFFGVVSALSGLTGVPLTARSYDFGILRIIPEFLAGVFLYLVMTEPAVKAAFSATALRVLVLVLILGFGVAAYVDLPDLVLIACLMAVLFVLGLQALGARPNALRHPALVYLGEISYSTYMVHYFILIIFNGVAQKLFHSHDFPLWYWLAMFAAIYAASALSYHWVELPARRFIRRHAD